MTLQELKQKRNENYKLFNEVIKVDIHSFFDKVLEEKCKEKFDKVFNGILKDYVNGETNVYIDFSNIMNDLFPKKNKFDTIEYQRTVVLGEERINYSLDFNGEEWIVFSDNLKMRYTDEIEWYIHNNLFLDLIKKLKKLFEEEIMIDVENDEMNIYFRG